MIDYFSVQLLGDPLIETAVSGLHVKDRNLPALGRNDRKCRIRVAVDEDGIWVFSLDGLVRLDDDLSDCLRDFPPRHSQEVVWLANLELLEEHFAHFVVVALSCMDEDMVRLLVQDSDHPAELDELGSSTADR